jgi:putative heme-binding domain-containing protein
VTGLFASETETRITVRRPGAQDANIPRHQIRSIEATGKSLMPDGLETGMSRQDLADLISFLRDPDASLLPL